MLDLWICALKWNTNFQFDDCLCSPPPVLLKPLEVNTRRFDAVADWLPLKPLCETLFVSVAWHSILLFFFFFGFCSVKRELLKRQHHVLLISVLYTYHHIRKQKKRDVTADNHTWILVGPQSYLSQSSRIFPCFHLERLSPLSTRERRNTGQQSMTKLYQNILGR